MSTLSSASTDAQVWATYDDAASYEEDSNRSKCLSFITACRILLRRRPKRLVAGGKETDFDDISIRQEMTAARAWLTAHPAITTSHVRFADFQDFRGEYGS